MRSTFPNTKNRVNTTPADHPLCHSERPKEAKNLRRAPDGVVLITFPVTCHHEYVHSRVEKTVKILNGRKDS
jgi:hypothetical protein